MGEWWEGSTPRDPGPEMVNISTLPPEEKREVWERVKSTPDLLETFELLLPITQYFGGQICLEKKSVESKKG